MDVWQYQEMFLIVATGRKRVMLASGQGWGEGEGGLEARDAAKHPTKHSTPSPQESSSFRFPIVPRLRNLVLNGESLRNHCVTVIQRYEYTCVWSVIFSYLYIVCDSELKPGLPCVLIR